MSYTPDVHSADEVIRALRLEPIPHEGGFFRRTAESPLFLDTPWGRRRAWSSIFALFTPEGFSALHRLRQDEVWCFHAGDPLESLRLPREPDSGAAVRVLLGLDAGQGQRLQDVVPAGTWQGTRLVPGGRWALVSCIVAPEFLWTDYEHGALEPLLAAYPGHADMIRALVRRRPA